MTSFQHVFSSDAMTPPPVGHVRRMDNQNNFEGHSLHAEPSNPQPFQTAEVKPDVNNFDLRTFVIDPNIV